VTEEELAARGVDLGKLAREGRTKEKMLYLFPDKQAPAELSEKDFMAEVVRFAKRNLWLVYHTHDSRKSAAGFPDLVLVRERVVWAELKAQDGKVAADQQTWIDSLVVAEQEVYLWRPSDWPQIQGVLA
jgi:hypothetical protein